MLASADKGQANHILLRLLDCQFHRQLSGNRPKAVVPVKHGKGRALLNNLRLGIGICQPQLQPF